MIIVLLDVQLNVEYFYKIPVTTVQHRWPQTLSVDCEIFSCFLTGRCVLYYLDL